MELEAALDPHHQVLACLMEPEASVMAPWEDLEAPASASEAQEDSPVLAPDWGAPASAQEVDLHLPARGQDQVPEATVLPQQTHQHLSEDLYRDQAYTGVLLRTPATTRCSLVTVAHILMAKAMVAMVWEALTD